MANSDYAALEAADQAFYDRTLLERATPELVHDKFGQDRPLKTRSTKKITFRRWNSLTANTTPLVEGITPVGTTLSKTDITATLKQYGDYVTITDVVQWTSRDPVLTEAAEVLGEQAGDSIDQVCRDILVAGTSVFCAEDDSGATGTTRTNVDGLINTVIMDKVIRYLQVGKAKPFTRLIKAGTGVGTKSVFPAYWGIIHPEVYYTARGLTGWVPVKDYAAQQEVMDQEVGSYNDLRMVMTTNAKIFADGGANVASGHKSTGTVKEDVYATLVFGRNAYGKVPLNGHSMENIVKPNGSGEDPLNQRATSGWKAMQTFIILNDAFMTRMETGAKA